MTDQIAYQEYIQRRYNAFCKTVIRCAALDKILKLKRQWERQVSLDYLMNEKFVQFAASEPDEEYPFTVCGQTVLLCNAALADAISVLPEQTREEILRYYFLRQPQRVIGACIGRSRSTAGRHIQLALQRLREVHVQERFAFSTSGINHIHDLGESGMKIRPWYGAVHAVEIVLTDVFHIPNTQIGHREQFRNAFLVLFHKPDLIWCQ